MLLKCEKKTTNSTKPHLVLPPFPYVPAHVELLLRVALLSDQVVELVHRKSDDVLGCVVLIVTRKPIDGFRNVNY